MAVQNDEIKAADALEDAAKAADKVVDAADLAKQAEKATKISKRVKDATRHVTDSDVLGLPSKMQRDADLRRNLSEYALEMTDGGDESGNSSNVYIPMDDDGNLIPLRKQTVNGQDIPLPDQNASGPHTVLGGKFSSKTGEVYRQSATFPEGTWPTANGQNVPWSEVHWTDHGTPHHHTNPHQHIFEYNPDKGGWIRKEPTPYYP